MDFREDWRRHGPSLPCWNVATAWQPSEAPELTVRGFLFAAPPYCVTSTVIFSTPGPACVTVNGHVPTSPPGSVAVKLPVPTSTIVMRPVGSIVADAVLSDAQVNVVATVL